MKSTRADKGCFRSMPARGEIIAAALICFAVLTPVNAYAYLDPGTGAFALQGLIAGIAGGVLSVRSYWKRVARLFSWTKTSSRTQSGPPRSNDHA